jgi:transcriptional antiterminator NusG
MEKSQEEFKWYVVRAISGQERKVKAMIESELTREKIAHNVPTILIPMEKVYEIKTERNLPKKKVFIRDISSLMQI